MDILSKEFLTKVNEKGVQQVAKELGWEEPRCVDPSTIRDANGQKLEHAFNVDFKEKPMISGKYIKRAYDIDKKRVKR